MRWYLKGVGYPLTAYVIYELCFIVKNSAHDLGPGDPGLGDCPKLPLQGCPFLGFKRGSDASFPPPLLSPCPKASSSLMPRTPIGSANLRPGHLGGFRNPTRPSYPEWLLKKGADI